MVNHFLKERFKQLKENQPLEVVNLLNAMEYTVGSGGKRIRALLALAAAGAVSGDENSGLPGALAVELIHSYSLIHDDLPALDNDDLRRGKPTCHIVFKEDVAILAGDALQALAFEILSETAKISPLLERAAKAIIILAKACGPLTLVGGQAMDLIFEQKKPTLEECVTMAKRKTGELIAASLGVGGALAGADDEALMKLKNIGLLAGEAFQITDDLLNLEGDPALLGKATGTDNKRGKMTIVSLLSPEKAKERANKLILNALELSKNFASPKIDFLLNSLVNRSY
jgi:geranylgeranyl diphosphate synthase type II